MEEAVKYLTDLAITISAEDANTKSYLLFPLLEIPPAK